MLKQKKLAILGAGKIGESLIRGLLEAEAIDVANVIVTAAHQQRRVPNLALRLAEGTPVGASPLLDYLIVSSDSVGQGLDRLTRYLRLVNPGVRIVVRDKSDPVRVAAFDQEAVVVQQRERFARLVAEGVVGQADLFHPIEQLRDIG